VTGICAVLLAAGESTRMGQPKPLLPWGEVPVVQFQVRGLAEAGAARVVVVLGHLAEEVALAVQGSESLSVVINDDYCQGKTTSIKTGLRYVCPDTEDVLLLSVDQPRPIHILRQLIETHTQGQSLITQPSYQDKGGHPIIFSGSLVGELRDITEEREGIREVVCRHADQICRVPIDDPLVLLDLNTPEDYQRSLVLFQHAGTSG
jgi:molybdenum cofactor cytidylyltransferase